ncbi:hypothetical protein L1049_018185 [Liquidambar formosana]|uniref:Uncharacterized protein n=1 Tax=Liquidambar formosana TaxID=63359 RepID=A0AAP0R9P5_LIQFO
MEGREKMDEFRVGPLPNMYYIPDFITDSEQTQLLNNIYQAPVSKWKSLKNRRLQNWDPWEIPIRWDVGNVKLGILIENLMDAFGVSKSLNSLFRASMANPRV